MNFNEIALILVVAATSGAVAKFFKQPLLIGYLFAGFFLSLFGFVHETETLESLGQIGVALLLFLVGLDMNIREAATTGKVAVMTGIGQIVFTSFFGFLLALLLGFAVVPSLYIAVALTFSSTIIVVKLLSEKNDLDSLYGKIALGMLLVQDLVVILILMFMAGLSAGDFTALSFAMIGVKGAFLLGATWFLSKRILPKVYTMVVDASAELVFIVSIAWALGVAAFVSGPLGFSLEIGGFLAGLALSNLPEHVQVASRTRPLRDFFLTLFFFLLGTSLVVEGAGSLIVPATVLSLFVLIGNPFIVILIMSLMRYRSRTSFLTSVTVAQISEFSLIMVASGAALGHLTDSHVAVVVMVGVVTMTLSTYMISHSDYLYLKLKGVLGRFERKNLRELVGTHDKELEGHVVLVGADRTGRALLPSIKKAETGFVVVDFNPAVVMRLIADRVPVVFGDINDDEVAAAATLRKAKLLVMTSANAYDALSVINKLRSERSRPFIIAKAETRGDAIRMYEAGADYVVVPEVVAGEHIRHLLKVYGYGGSKLEDMGKHHFKRLLKS